MRGLFVSPVERQYFDVITSITGKVYTQAARSTAADIELALDAAHAAKANWAATPAAARANILLKIADRIDANLELLACAETADNSSPRCSRATTTCACSAKRSSARCWP